MIISAALCLVAAVALAAIIGFANGMSDNPTERAFSYRLPAVLLAIAICLFGVWYITPAHAAAADAIRPDPKLTPGVVRTDISEDQVCKIKWGKDQRAVTEAMKRQVFEEYGYPKLNKDPRCPCEIDHLVSRELLGADDVKNLWVQPYDGIKWNARRKDRTENYLHREVCTGKMSLKAAQDAIRTDWIAAYERAFGEP